MASRRKELFPNVTDAEWNDWRWQVRNRIETLEELKKGYPLSFVYAQTYIPLYAVYDFKNKEYVYVFDTRYVDLDKDNSTVRLNLFELKVMNEDTIDEKGKDLESVRNNDILRGVIDVKF